MKKIDKIKIEQTDDSGFIVKVGCKTIVFKNKKELIDALTKYTDDPEKIEAEYSKKYGWSDGDPIEVRALVGRVGGMRIEEDCDDD